LKLSNKDSILFAYNRSVKSFNNKRLDDLWAIVRRFRYCLEQCEFLMSVLNIGHERTENDP